MPADLKSVSGQQSAALTGLAAYPLLDALVHRRSRRFGCGFALAGGPLAYRSERAPAPLTIDEEAALAFAACGCTGYALGELPCSSDSAANAGGGNIMKRFVGRTVPSGDAIHTSIVFVINDEGAWMLKRPQDFAPAETNGLIEAAKNRRLRDLYEQSRVRLGNGRASVPRELPFLPPFNKWSANLPGTTYFVPIAELTELYLNSGHPRILRGGR